MRTTMKMLVLTAAAVMVVGCEADPERRSQLPLRLQVSPRVQMSCDWLSVVDQAALIASFEQRRLDGFGLEQTIDYIRAECEYDIDLVLCSLTIARQVYAREP